MVSRLSIVLCVAFFGLTSVATTCCGQEVAKKVDAEKQVPSSEFLLPSSTKAWVSVPDPAILEAKFDETQFGLLAKDPAIKPFVESFQAQAKEWFDDQNVRLGISFDDLHGVHSGEVCLAGVLPQIQGNAGGAHGLVLMVDVTDTAKEATELLKKINAAQVKRGAEKSELTIYGISAQRYTLKDPKRFRKNPTNLQAIVNNHLLICDNEVIFRDLLQRLAMPAKVKKAQTLSAQVAFAKVMEKTDLKKHADHIRWYVDPFGYAQLAQELDKEERVSRPQSDDWVKTLKDQGFGAWKGIGGRVSIATGEHEVLHRTFTYAPRKSNNPNAKRMFDLFDFSGNKLEPQSWVPADCSAHVTVNWQLSKALTSVGHLFDAFMDNPGDWKRLLHDLKADPDTPIDIEKLVGLIDNRFTVVSALESPVTETSERVVIGAPIKGQPEYIFNSLKKALKAEEINLGGIKVLKLESSSQDDDLVDDDVFEPLGDDDEFEFEDEDNNDRFELFATKYIVIHKGNLLVANDKNYLKKILAQKVSKLSKLEDYVQVKDAIFALTNKDKVCWQHFGRLDKSLEANYEMLRKGEMGKSETVLARMINQVFSKAAKEQAAVEGNTVDEIRKQKLDGSKLPEDYNKSIAPYLGLMGWVMEEDVDGWRITGVVLKKKGMTEVVQKLEADKAQR